jgi:exopolysaccharide production protein ExoQ
MKLHISKESLFRLYLLICVLVLTKAYTWIYTGQGVYILDNETSKGMRLHSHFGFLLLASLLFYNWKALLFSPSLRLVMAIFLYFLITAFWAFNFKESVRMSISILFQIALASAIVKNASINMMLARLAYVAKSILVLNCIFIVFFNNLAFESGYFGGSYAGAMRGIFSSKNTFGAMIAFAYSMLLMQLLLTKNEKKTTGLTWLGLSFVLLILSMSVTSIFAALCSTLITALISSKWYLSSKQSSRVTFLLIFFVLLGVATVALEPILSFFGRDLTFTGRTEIWAFSLEYFAEKPIFGYGLNSFWREMLEFNLLIENGLWNIAQAHNGFVDAFLAGGIIGGALVLLIYINMLRIIISEITKSHVSIYTPVLLVFFWLSLIQNLSETSFPYGMRVTGTLIALFFITHFIIKSGRVLNSNKR